MENCIFCKIARHEMPADILFEDENTIAFLDIKPAARGHALVIPKKHAVDIFDVDDETLAATMKTVRKIAPALRDAVGAKGLHINSNHHEAAGQIVFHIHFHLIPRRDRSEFEFWQKKDIDEKDAKTIAAAVQEKLS